MPSDTNIVASTFEEEACKGKKGQASRWYSMIIAITLPPAIRLLGRYRPHLAPRVLLLTRNLIVKYGSSQLVAEARAISFVSKNTAIPVPEIVTSFFSSAGHYYILMKRCPGVPLGTVFYTLSSTEKRNVLRQLRDYMNELRALKPPKPGWIGSTGYGPIEDGRVSSSPCGPFKDVSEFHKAIRGGAEGVTGHDECDKLIAAQNSRKHHVTFTHGDLSFRHVFYLDGRITGIIDWESAGWFPDYWEYTMAWDSFWGNPGLRDQILQFLDGFPRELEMEQIRRRLFLGG